MPELDNEQGGEERSARPFWSGTITFGLVSIPVSLFPANRQSRVPLRMLSGKRRPVARRYYAPATGRQLSPEEMVRGYEIQKDQYVVITDDELERLEPKKSRDIDLRRFVPEESIPPLYFERSYFLTPAGGSEKAYRLLAATMDETNRAGIATFVMRGKEYLVAIFSENGILLAETLRFAGEIRSPRDVGLPAIRTPDAREVRSFASAIAKLSADDLSKREMEDETAEQLMKLARRKQSKQQDVVKTEAPGKGGDVIDILAVLKRSLGQLNSGEKRPARAGSRNDLQEQSRSELYEKAKALNISGRSSMSKDQLIQAIRRVE